MTSPRSSKDLRSCDRCFIMKTQCDLAEVCGRCKRLGLECTNIRPVKSKGRPRKSQRPNQPQGDTQPPTRGRTPERVSPYPPDMIIQAVLTGLNQHVDPLLAGPLLQHIRTLRPGHGLCAVMLAEPHSAVDNGLDIHNPALYCSIISIVLELWQRRVHQPDEQSLQQKRDLIREEALSRIPHIFSRSEPSVSDALSLLLLSHTWCLTSQHIDAAAQWTALAHFIINNSIKGRDLLSYAPREVDKRVSFGCTLQESTLNLLHYSAINHGEQKVATDHLYHIFNVSPVSECNSASASQRFPAEYLALFIPLIRICSLVLTEPPSGSRDWLNAYDDIEAFYIAFPISLLRFDNLRFLYQAEAMVWMHGLLIILYVGRDLLSILLRPLDDDTLRHVLNHSLLIGEVLPSIERLADGFEDTSPALIFFLLLSCAVHIATLGRYALDQGRAVLFAASDESGTSASIPQKIITSSWMHLHIVSQIRKSCPRYDLPLLTDIERLLAVCYSRTVLGVASAETVSATQLMLYRWKGRGGGVAPLRVPMALAEWEFPQRPEDDILKCIPNHTELSPGIVAELCDSQSRIVQEGYFDLSIVIP
ncbi:hypothetical protein BDV27DRAFT_66015 [Aspergillus caelatus]|uniref:Zn(2)-C6 fungal-type domain-containing protein n=1 Tax=Aspergillus caelatus TaxID=61420 RepID=A0A5N6ZMF0_9EURO|nr:uncharacterized protein BDV27DRAFT_66015 [Aspergillus caelatus]KAE8358635.1 hypothetical protein BDV27DRAFT_66015 [Aspergillus caelatus]